jgi:hypothetical protein
MQLVKKQIYELALESLRANLVKTPVGPLLRAGSYQFGSFWTRDFCFAARGAFEVFPEIVLHHLNFLISKNYGGSSRGYLVEGLVPRLIETQPSARRVLVGMARRSLGLSGFPQNYFGKVRWEYLGEHRTPALDGNFLVLLLAARCVKKDPRLLLKWAINLQRIWKATDAWCDDSGWVVQPSYSDWQDSVKRRGKSLYLNVLKLRCQAVAKRLGLQPCKRELTLERLLEKFHYQEKLLKSHESFDLVSQEGVLLLCEALVEESLFEDSISRKVELGVELARSLFQSLNSFSSGFAYGQASCPSYPRREVSFFTQAVGLREYHGSLKWSWLSALNYKMARQLGFADSAEKVIQVMNEVFVRDKVISEIYHPDLTPFSSGLYHSEAPFSWGAGMWIEAIRH